jgi:hypothetical protein
MEMVAADEQRIGRMDKVDNSSAFVNEGMVETNWRNSSLYTTTELERRRLLTSKLIPF